MSKPALLIISGPTAIGKTEISLQLAEYFQTEIISCDSRQMYRELKIGTAAPSNEELIRVEHHFVGNLSIHDTYNVFKYEQEVMALLENAFQERDLMILTGGSNLYINAICYGIDEMPDPEPKLREELTINFQQHGISYLQDRLKLLDEDMFNSIDKANPLRIMRAIEVCLSSGKKFSELRSNKIKERDFQIIKILLQRHRNQLYMRINERVDLMMQNGLLDEARRMYPFKNLNALNTVGYKELFYYFDGNCTLDEAIEKVKTNSRRYAKRQITWFNKHDDWIKVSLDEPSIAIENIIQMVNRLRITDSNSFKS